MTNKELAQIFANVADLLELKGEVVYKTLAYRRAAQNIADYGRDVTQVWKEGQLRQIPGVGTAIAEKIDELLSTGKLNFYEKLKQEIPVGLVEMLAVPDVGPKKAVVFWKQLGITSVAELEKAAREGKLRELPGMGEKSETRILAGIQARARRATERRSLGQAWPIAQELLRFLRQLPDVKAAEAAGSLRRMRSTIGDLDFLVAAENAEPIMQAFARHPQVARVLGQGPTKTAVELVNGLQADLRVLPAQRFGTLLQYFTGSKEHNVRLRELALAKGLSLNEHALTRKNGQEILCATEAEVYKTLGLAYIPPELREDRGEIQAAARGALPRLIELRDVQSDLHSHTTWSDGATGIREMALAARSRGLKCLAITDHSQSLGITGGMTPERVRAQRKEIDRTQVDLGAGFSLLQGAEVEIRADGQLDYPDDVLEDLDIVVASIHTSLRQERDRVTARLIRAIENRRVDVIGHPTGRLFPNREGADLDMEAVLKAAADSGVALEINANPERLDLDDAYAHRALELGCLLAINTDAHHPDHFDLAHFGIGVARRAWATADRVINAWPVEKLLQWLEERDHPHSRARSEVRPVGDTAAAPPRAVQRKGMKAGAPSRRRTAGKRPQARGNLDRARHTSKGRRPHGKRTTVRRRGAP